MGNRLTMRYGGNGNIIAWIDQTGTVVERIDYDPFGRVLTRQGGVEGLAFGVNSLTRPMRWPESKACL